MIAINPAKGSSVELTDEIVDRIVADIKSSDPIVFLIVSVLFFMFVGTFKDVFLAIPTALFPDLF